MGFYFEYTLCHELGGENICTIFYLMTEPEGGHFVAKVLYGCGFLLFLIILFGCYLVYMKNCSLSIFRDF